MSLKCPSEEESSTFTFGGNPRYRYLPYRKWSIKSRERNKNDKVHLLEAISCKINNLKAFISVCYSDVSGWK